MRYLASALIIVACCWSSADAKPSAAELAQVARAAEVGRDLYLRDRAAWVATDAVRPLYPDVAAAGLRGWVTEREGDAVTVTFIRERDGELSALRRGIYQDEKFALGADPEGAPLTDVQRRIYAAIGIASKAQFERCASRYNQIAVPRAPASETTIDVDVYLMPAPNGREIAFGGNHRIGVDVDAGKIVETQSFTRSCIALPKEPPQAPEGAEMTGLFITEIIQRTPNEIHVFHSMSNKVALFVATTARDVWDVQGDKIEWIKP